MKENEPNIHLPAPSYWPIVLAFSFMLIAMGVVSSIFVSLAGVILMLVALTGWTFENRTEELEHHDD